MSNNTFDERRTKAVAPSRSTPLMVPILFLRVESAYPISLLRVALRLELNKFEETMTILMTAKIMRFSIRRQFEFRLALLKRKGIGNTTGS
jgi:hypothetical protein